MEVIKEEYVVVLDLFKQTTYSILIDRRNGDQVNPAVFHRSPRRDGVQLTTPQEHGAWRCCVDE